VVSTSAIKDLAERVSNAPVWVDDVLVFGSASDDANEIYNSLFFFDTQSEAFKTVGNGGKYLHTGPVRGGPVALAGLGQVVVSAGKYTPASGPTPAINTSRLTLVDVQNPSFVDPKYNCSLTNDNVAEFSTGPALLFWPGPKEFTQWRVGAAANNSTGNTVLYAMNPHDTSSDPLQRCTDRLQGGGQASLPGPTAAPIAGGSNLNCLSWTRNYAAAARFKLSEPGLMRINKITRIWAVP